MAQGSLLGTMEPPRATGKKRQRPAVGHLVTNHLNLMYMLGAGLLLPPAGFGNKYYRDTLDCSPGWIPLFTGRPRRQAIGHTLVEAKHLKPCIVRISLKEFSGRVFSLESGDLQERRFPDEVGKAELLFLPAPLPTSAIEKILFRSVEERKACALGARDYANVPWTDFTTRTEAPRFSKALSGPWPPEGVPQARDTPLGSAQAAGAIMAMLRLMGNRSPDEVSTSGEPLGLAACRVAFDPPTEPAPELEATILGGLASWMHSGDQAHPAAGTISDFEGRHAWRHLFWGAVGRLARETGAGDRDDAAAALLEYLGDVSTRISSQLRERVRGLQDDLESLTGLGEFRASDLWRKYSTPLPRAMSLLFLRRTCSELLEFRAPELTEEDWLAAAVLFGARSGWLSLPMSLRGGPAASRAVSHRMATLSHRIAGTGFDLGPAPERPKPLAEWFLGSWSARQRSAALELARKQAWDCIETRVKLGRGDYRLEVARGGMEIVFPGEAKAVDTAVDRDRFLKLLAETAVVDPKIEALVAEKLRV